MKKVCLSCPCEQVAPENPKAWRALVDFLETGNDRRALADAIKKCINIAESKGNYGRSRPLRIRLSEVLEAAGDRRGALSALKEFTSNPAAMSATNLPQGASGDKSPPGGGRHGPSAASKSANAAKLAAAKSEAEATRDAENASLKERSTRLFMEINADLVPAPAPVPALRPIESSRPKPPSPPPKPVATTVAAAAAIAAAAAAEGPKVSKWIRAASEVQAPSAEDIVAMGDAERLETLAEHCACLEEPGNGAKRRRAAVAVAQSISASGAEAPWVEAQLRELLSGGGGSATREGALFAIQALCEISGAAGEPYVVDLLPLVLDAHGDQSPAVRGAALDAGAALARTLNPHALRLALPALTEAVGSDAWRIKAGALEVIATLAEHSPAQVALSLPEIVPVVSHQVSYDKQATAVDVPLIRQRG